MRVRVERERELTAWLVMGGSSGIVHDRRVNLDTHPCPSIMASCKGLGGLAGHQYYIEVDVKLVKDGGKFKGKFDLDNGPSPSINAGGITGVGLGQYWIEESEDRMPGADDKPPYKVPTMAEIEAIPWNGYKVVSSFTGAGGSCLGFRMAGFRRVDCFWRWMNFAAWVAVK